MTPSNIQSITALWQDSFKDIQCYQDEQVNSVLQRLLADPQFVPIIEQLFSLPEAQLEAELQSLLQVDTVEALQNWVEKNIFPLVASSYDDFTVSGLNDLDPADAYVFISNHRDIVMDPLLLNRALRAHNFTTANCAIGDNLLQHPSANDLALLNRCFKVFRSIKSPRAILNAMKTQSAYIQYLHFSKRENIWIAQKEGRAKDSIDKTNPALIKMLGLAKPKDVSISDYLSLLKIVPVSFSYEWDPCDVDKAIELAAQDENADYTKDKLDDFIATKKGLQGNKGNIHIHFGNVISTESNEPLEHKRVAKKVDQSILSNYKHYPVNHAAYKKLKSEITTACPYSKQDINNASKRLDKQLEGKTEDIKKRVYSAYAQVLMHQD